MLFWRETAAQHWPQFAQDLASCAPCQDKRRMPCPDVHKSCWHLPNFSVGGEYPGVCSTRLAGQATPCVEDAARLVYVLLFAF